MKRVPLLVPDMPSRRELSPYLERIDEARWYTNFGPLARELEQRLERLFEAPPSQQARVVTMANATLALEMALTALDLPPGSRVLLPAVTFVASATAIVRSHHVPVLCDVDRHTWLLTPEIAERAAGQAGAAAAMPVAAYGCPQDPEAWDSFTRRTGIPAIIDAAAAFANQVRCARTPAIYSLHATKTLGAGEGAFVASTDAALLEELRRASNFGIHLPEGLVRRAGTNAKLSEYHAAVALASLDRFGESGARRARVHARYLDALSTECPAVALQRRPAQGVYSIMPVMLPRETAAGRIAADLASKGIETRRWYCPTIDEHPAFAGVPRAAPLEVTADIGQRLLALPFHTRLADEDIHRVCTALRAALANGVRAGRR